MISIFVEYSIDCAHFLPLVPSGHKCGRLHGHRYEIRLEVSGPLVNGWVIDYADLKAIADSVILRLDHQCLNDLMPNPTCEHIGAYIFGNISPLLPPSVSLDLVMVRETERAGVIVRGEK